MSSTCLTSFKDHQRECLTLHGFKDLNFYHSTWYALSLLAELSMFLTQVGKYQKQFQYLNIIKTIMREICMLSCFCWHSRCWPILFFQVAMKNHVTFLIVFTASYSFLAKCMPDKSVRNLYLSVLILLDMEFNECI